MPRIVILATGGTISSRDTSSGGSVATDSAEALIGTLGATLGDVTVEAVDLLRKNSFNLSMGDLRAVAVAITQQLERDDIDGIVVTHGTDTLEETAFLADLVHADSRPVVFTGAQIAADREASDGPRNLRDAILVAASPRSRDLGVLVSFAGDVFAARGLRKRHSLQMAPFGSLASGPLGHVVGQEVTYVAQPVRSENFELPSESFDGIRVELMLTYPGVDALFFDAAVAAGARGIVIAGAGTGNTNIALVDALTKARDNDIVVALASRAGDGPVLPIYGAGGAVDAVAAGAVPTGSLPMTQTRILLALLLDRYPAAEAAERLRRFCALC